MYLNRSLEFNLDNSENKPNSPNSRRVFNSKEYETQQFEEMKKYYIKMARMLERLYSEVVSYGFINYVQGKACEECRNSSLRVRPFCESVLNEQEENISDIGNPASHEPSNEMETSRLHESSNELEASHIESNLERDFLKTTPSNAFKYNIHFCLKPECGKKILINGDYRTILGETFVQDLVSDFEASVLGKDDDAVFNFDRWMEREKYIEKKQYAAEVANEKRMYVHTPYKRHCPRCKKIEPFLDARFRKMLEAQDPNSKYKAKCIKCGIYYVPIITWNFSDFDRRCENFVRSKQVGIEQLADQLYDNIGDTFVDPRESLKFKSRVDFKNVNSLMLQDLNKSGVKLLFKSVERPISKHSSSRQISRPPSQQQPQYGASEEDKAVASRKKSIRDFQDPALGRVKTAPARINAGTRGIQTLAQMTEAVRQDVGRLVVEDIARFRRVNAAAHTADELHNHSELSQLSHVSASSYVFNQASELSQRFSPSELVHNYEIQERSGSSHHVVEIEEQVQRPVAQSGRRNLLPIALGAPSRSDSNNMNDSIASSIRRDSANKASENNSLSLQSKSNNKTEKQQQQQQVNKGTGGGGGRQQQLVRSRGFKWSAGVVGLLPPAIAVPTLTKKDNQRNLTCLVRIFAYFVPQVEVYKPFDTLHLLRKGATADGSGGGKASHKPILRYFFGTFDNRFSQQHITFVSKIIRIAESSSLSQENPSKENQEDENSHLDLKLGYSERCEYLCSIKEEFMVKWRSAIPSAGDYEILSIPVDSLFSINQLDREVEDQQQSGAYELQFTVRMYNAPEDKVLYGYFCLEIGTSSSNRNDNFVSLYKSTIEASQVKTDSERDDIMDNILTGINENSMSWRLDYHTMKVVGPISSDMEAYVVDAGEVRTFPVSKVEFLCESVNPAFLITQHKKKT